MAEPTVRFTVTLSGLGASLAKTKRIGSGNPVYCSLATTFDVNDVRCTAGLKRSKVLLWDAGEPLQVATGEEFQVTASLEELKDIHLLIGCFAGHSRPATDHLIGRCEAALWDLLHEPSFTKDMVKRGVVRGQLLGTCTVVPQACGLVLGLRRVLLRQSAVSGSHLVVVHCSVDVGDGPQHVWEEVGKATSQWLSLPDIRLPYVDIQLQSLTVHLRFTHLGEEGEVAAAGQCLLPLGTAYRSYATDHRVGWQPLLYTPVVYEGSEGSFSCHVEFAGLPIGADASLTTFVLGAARCTKLHEPTAYEPALGLVSRKHAKHMHQLASGGLDDALAACKHWCKEAKKRPECLTQVPGLVTLLVPHAFNGDAEVQELALHLLAGALGDSLNIQEYFLAGGLELLVAAIGDGRVTEALASLLYTIVTPGYAEVKQVVHESGCVRVAMHAVELPTRPSVELCAVLVRAVGAQLFHGTVVVEHVRASVASVVGIFDVVLEEVRQEGSPEGPWVLAFLPKFLDLCKSVFPYCVSDEHMSAMESFLATLVCHCCHVFGPASAEETFATLCLLSGADRAIWTVLKVLKEQRADMRYLAFLDAHVSGNIAVPPPYRADADHMADVNIAENAVSIFDWILGQMDGMVNDDVRCFAIAVVVKLLQDPEHVLALCWSHVLGKVLEKAANGDEVCQGIVHSHLLSCWRLEEELVGELVATLTTGGPGVKLPSAVMRPLKFLLDLLLTINEERHCGKAFCRQIGDADAVVADGLDALCLLLRVCSDDACQRLSIQLLLTLVSTESEEVSDGVRSRLLRPANVDAIAVSASSHESAGHMAALEVVRLLACRQRGLTHAEVHFSAILATLSRPSTPGRPAAVSDALVALQEVVDAPSFAQGTFRLVAPVVQDLSQVLQQVCREEDRLCLLRCLLLILDNNQLNAEIILAAGGSGLWSKLMTTAVPDDNADLAHLQSHAGQVLLYLLGLEREQQLHSHVDTLQCAECAANLLGTSYLCVNCTWHPLCSLCERRGMHPPHHTLLLARKRVDLISRLPHGLPVLYSDEQIEEILAMDVIGEDMCARQHDEVCDHCGTAITGLLFVCRFCPSTVVLCAACEGDQQHEASHCLLKCPLMPALLPATPFAPAASNGGWFAVATTLMDHRTQAAFCGSDLFAEIAIDGTEDARELVPTQWDNRVLRVTHVAMHRWQYSVLCEDSQKCGFVTQKIFRAASFPTSLVASYCSLGYRVTTVSASPTDFVVVLSMCSFDVYEEQQVIRTDVFPIEWIQQARMESKGRFSLTHIAATDSEWVAIMSSAWIWRDMEQTLRYGTATGMEEWIKKQSPFCTVAVACQKDMFVVVAADAKWMSQETFLLSEPVDAAFLAARAESGARVTTLVGAPSCIEQEGEAQMFSEYRLPRSSALTVAAAGGKDSSCTVCMDATANTVFLDCGHICCCEECAGLLVQSVCPLCRDPILRAVRTYRG